jgi:DNA-binding transcriptional LysR family regulator
MDRLMVMRSFVTVADLGSFSAAAKELYTSGSQISRHVADLERKVGAQLVNRTARSVSLTELGIRYSDFARRILAEIEEEDVAIAQLRDRPEGPLSVISPKWIGTLDLGDAVAEFAVTHPKITTKFEIGGMSDRTYDFLDSGFDVAFHTRDLRDSRVHQQRIAKIPFVLCAAASYLEERGEPADANDLAGHDCLVHVSDLVWNLGTPDGITPHKVQRVSFSSNSYLTLQKVAVSGRGIALLPWRSVADAIDAGTMRVVLPHLTVPERPLYAIYGPGKRTPEKVNVFLAFMKEWFAKNPLADSDVDQRRPA